jgi:beta-glucosidase
VIRRAAVLTLLLLGAFVSSAAASGRCGNHPWCDTSLSPDVRADLLIQALTQDEKVSLLAGDDPFGVGGGEHAHTGTSNGVPRLDLPTTYYSDGPVGPRQGKSTAMPIPMALAATFDPGLASLHGGTIANEARSKGNDVVFAPTVNVMRTPLNGRTFEAYGEDPFLVSRLTVGWIRGAQAQGVIANVKHYAANNQEGDAGALAGGSAPGQPLGPPGTQGNRLTVNAQVDERTLREIYLPQFEAAVKEANVGSVMCSYNRLNGQYACENTHLLQEVLERDWGFKGYVLADYGADHNTIASLNNGLDFEPWPGVVYSPALVNAATASGQVAPATIDVHLHRVLRTQFAYGFFDRAAFADNDAQIDKPAHAKAAQDIEEAAITLLENRGSALPLDPAKLKSIAVIGSDASKFKTGGGSGAVTPFAFTTPLDAIAQRAGSGVKVAYDDGSNPDTAAAAAKGSDVAVVFAGDYETEGADRQCLSLECPPYNGDQDALIERVAAANPNTVVVLESGGPVLTPWRDRVKALVEAWYPGQQGGPAIARVLFGDVDPGGRLPVTFPQSEADLPTAGDPEKYPGVAETVTYKEGVFVGYRWYDENKLTPAYPFGFGKSYTRFSYSRLRVGAADADGTQKVSFRVRNDGKRAGIDVPQVYLGVPAAGSPVPEPPRRLAGFKRIALAAGASRTVSIPVARRSRQYWDVAGSSWKDLPGCLPVLAAASSRDVRLRSDLCASGAGSSGACARRYLEFHLRGRVTRVDAFVDGRRVKRVRGKRIRVVEVLSPAKSSWTVRLVAHMSGGRRVISTYRYRRCRHVSTRRTASGGRRSASPRFSG